MAQPPLLTLAEIALTFGGNPVFDGVSLSVAAGARSCVVGRNGSGKSTLLKVMAGVIEPDRGDRFLQPGCAVGYMEQDPDLSGFATLGDFAASGLGAGEDYRIEMAAKGLKLALDRTPGAASGGERRRAALAKLLAEAPDLMLLDEPTNHLDIEAIAWLEGHLSACREGFVLISHDRAFLRALTRATIWVDRGEVRQQARGFDAFEVWRDKTYAEEDLNRHKLNRLIKAEARWAVEGISARRKRNQGRVRRLADLRADRSGQISRQGSAALDLGDAVASGKRVIEARGISKNLGGQSLVNDFSLRIGRGDRVAFVGPNGSGKTTLINLLTGQLVPDVGTVTRGTNLIPAIFDQNRAALEPEASLWDTLTRDKELGVSGKNDQIMVRGNPRHVVGYLKDFLFSESQARGPVKALSGGEKARLLLARLMARESNLLVLDEPTNDLDVETLDLLQELLADYAGTVLLVSHDRDFLDRVAGSCVIAEGAGRWQVYAGGWSDARAQGADPTRTRHQAIEKGPGPKPANKPPQKKPTPVLPARA
ncbi:MAG: ATP-binding cassette domain-containing protein, partial [Pseudomonadota bacterium]